MTARARVSLGRAWWAFLSLSLVLGFALRTLFVHDMEWKEDEQINFHASQAIAFQGEWPWIGMPSGVYLANPGMSLWVFGLAARIFGAHTPTDLAHAVQIVAWLGIALILPFALRFVLDEREREPWLWAMALALVNPILVWYQRKLWPEPFMPVFILIALMGYWRRERFGAAFLWGMVAAWLGQIHMAGFFSAFALTAWTFLFARKSVNWLGWFLGSCAGAASLAPWVISVFHHPIHEKMTGGLNEAIQLKFWVFWVSDPLGLHVGNTLGLLRGNSHLAQLADFFRYPLLAGHSTYLVAVAHAVIAAIFLGGAAFLAPHIWRSKNRVTALIGRENTTSFVQNAMGLGFGAVLTASCVNIRRYYMAASFPFEFIFLARQALKLPKGRHLLLILWAAQLLVSAAFVGYIHVNHGSVQGDYGRAYRCSQPGESCAN